MGPAGDQVDVGTALRRGPRRTHDRLGAKECDLHHISRHLHRLVYSINGIDSWIRRIELHVNCQRPRLGAIATTRSSPAWLGRAVDHRLLGRRWGPGGVGVGGTMMTIAATIASRAPICTSRCTPGVIETGDDPDTEGGSRTAAWRCIRPGRVVGRVVVSAEVVRSDAANKRTNAPPPKARHERHDQERISRPALPGPSRPNGQTPR